VQVQVLDITGRLVSSSKILVNGGQNQNSIRTALLLPGIYNLHITTEDGVLANLRFVKE
jgi:hypothetical protein